MQRSNGLPGRLAELGGYAHLLRNLVARDLKLKYKGSTLGFLWSLANPLLMLVVYTFAFRYVLRVQIDNFPLFFIAGYLPFVFLSGAVSTSATCILENGSLLNKIYFPRIALPYSVVLSHGIQFLLALVSLLPVFWLMGMRLSVAILLLPWVVVMQTILVLGLAQMVASAHTFFRDTRHFVEVFLTVWFWITPIVYTPEMIPSRLRVVLDWNPLASMLEAYRAILLEGALPPLEPFVAMHVWAVVVFLIGDLVFSRTSYRFAELV